MHREYCLSRIVAPANVVGYYGEKDAKLDTVFTNQPVDR